MTAEQKAAQVTRRLLGQKEPDNKVHRVKDLPVAYKVFVENKFPSIDKSGSVSGMKKLYWGKSALCVRCGGYIYNVTGREDIYQMAN